ncbi:uncharacterized protein [Amphiura filiformis]|uniref:uncharacterized protein n=1 Tax=Amphiura filiformis TaxID=82378 RepID=UPI003B20BE67
MKAKKNSQQTGGSGAGQLGVQKNTLKTFGTIYGSSLLRSLQTPERQQLADRSRQLQQHGTPQKTPVQIKVEPGSSPAQSTLSPGQKQISSVGSRQKRTLSPGTRQLTQRQHVLQANQSAPGASGPQLCLKFVKATGPDGKPGLTAILGASPGQQGASPQQKQTPSKGASPLQTQQQPQRMMQLSGPPKMALASSVQKSPGRVLPTRVPAPVRTQKGNSKSVPAPRDETQEAVDALIASTSDASEATSAASTEPRIGNWKNKPRAERRQDLAKTEKLLNALRTLMSQQRSQVEAGMQQLQSKASQEKSPESIQPNSSQPGTSQQNPQMSQNSQSQVLQSKVSQVNPSESIQPNSSQSQPGTSQQNPQMSQNSQSQVLAALQLQKSFETGASPQKTQSESGTSPQQSQVERSPRIMGYRKRAPHKLPPR